jgi:hypothetical protein
VENRRKALKADSLAFGRLVDSKAKEITSALSEIENHLQAQQDVIDKEKERRRLAIEEAAQAKLQERLALLEAERLEQQKKIAEQEAEAKQLRDELIAKQRAELVEQERQLALAREAERKAEAERLAEQRRREVELALAKAKQEQAEAAARKAAKDKAVFDAVRQEFPTIEACWLEITRLRLQ